jgi:cell division septum initiation protein DivIVA
MEWREPHPRRIATPDEVQENKQQIEAIDGQIKQMTRTAEESSQKLLQLKQERTNLLSLIDRRVPIKILRKIALRCVKSKIQTINGSIDEMVSMTEELAQKLLQLRQEQANRLPRIVDYQPRFCVRFLGIAFKSECNHLFSIESTRL